MACKKEILIILQQIVCAPSGQVEVEVVIVSALLPAPLVELGRLSPWLFCLFSALDSHQTFQQAEQ